MHTNLSQMCVTPIKVPWHAIDPSLWRVVVDITPRGTVHDIKQLKHATTDAARARAWIRIALNEGTLQSFVASLLANTSLLQEHYDPHAFLRDEEQAAKLDMLLAGLSFAVPVQL